MAVSLRTIKLARKVREQAGDLLAHAEQTRRRMEETNDLKYKEHLGRVIHDHARRAHNLVKISREMISED